MKSAHLGHESENCEIQKSEELLELGSSWNSGIPLQ